MCGRQNLLSRAMTIHCYLGSALFGPEHYHTHKHSILEPTRKRKSQKACLRVCGIDMVALGNGRRGVMAVSQPRGLLQTTAMAKGSNKAAEGKKGGKAAAKSEESSDKQKVRCKAPSFSPLADSVFRFPRSLAMLREARAA